VVWLGVVEQYVVTADIDETPLRDVGVALVVHDRGQVRLGPERPEAGFFEPFPEVHKVGEADVPRVDFQLELAERQRAALVFRKERVEHVEFGAFDIELEDVDEGVAVESHEPLEGVFWDLGRFLHFWPELPWLESDAGLEFGDVSDLGTPLEGRVSSTAYWVTVEEDLRCRRRSRSRRCCKSTISPKGPFRKTIPARLLDMQKKATIGMGHSEGSRGVARTRRVNDAVFLMDDALKATHPFPSVTQNTDPCDREWARESWDEKVPYEQEQANSVSGPGIQRLFQTPAREDVHIV